MIPGYGHFDKLTSASSAQAMTTFWLAFLDFAQNDMCCNCYKRYVSVIPSSDRQREEAALRVGRTFLSACLASYGLPNRGHFDKPFRQAQRKQ